MCAGAHAPTRVEDEVVLDKVTAAKAVVEVETRASKVETEIAPESGASCLGLEPARGLLLPDARLSNHIAFNQGEPAECGWVGGRVGTKEK
jgi:hypothetical protein